MHESINIILNVILLYLCTMTKILLPTHSSYVDNEINTRTHIYDIYIVMVLLIIMYIVS